MRAHLLQLAPLKALASLRLHEAAVGVLALEQQETLEGGTALEALQDRSTGGRRIRPSRKTHFFGIHPRVARAPTNHRDELAALAAATLDDLSRNTTHDRAVDVMRVGDFRCQVLERGRADWAVERRPAFRPTSGRWRSWTREVGRFVGATCWSFERGESGLEGEVEERKWREGVEGEEGGAEEGEEGRPAVGRV